MRVCPICREGATHFCKCPKSDSTCKNGHEWHYCVAHDEIKTVIGPSDHLKPVNECSCLKEEETMNEVPVCPKCQERNMPCDDDLNKALAMGEGTLKCSACSTEFSYKAEVCLVFTECEELEQT